MSQTFRSEVRITAYEIQTADNPAQLLHHLFERAVSDWHRIHADQPADTLLQLSMRLTPLEKPKGKKKR